MDYKLIVDLLASNPAIVWPIVSGVVSFAFRWMGNHSPGGAKMLSAVSVDMPLLWEGLLEFLGKAPSLPPAEPLQ